MGYSLSWLAVQGLRRDAVFELLSLTPNGVKCTYPFQGVCAYELPGPWVLIAANRCGHRIIGPEVLQGLSAEALVVACAVEEHVNYASSEAWHKSLRTWKVEHEGEAGSENITVLGNPPSEYANLLKSVELEDSSIMDGHFHMDIPLLLAKQITGFRHDDDISSIDYDGFETLLQSTAPRRWWQIWS